MRFQHFLRGFIFLLLCQANESSAQIKNYHRLKFIEPIIYSLEEKATQIQPGDRKYKNSEFGQVVTSYEDIDGKSIYKSGVISKTGKFILPKIFISIVIWKSNPDLAFVHSSNHAIYNLKTKKWIDSYDNISYSYLDLDFFIVTKQNEDYLLNKECKRVFHKPGYYISEILNNDLILVKNKMTLLYGIYDFKKNKFIIDDKFYNIDKPYKFNAFIAKDNHLYYLFRLDGERLNKDKYLKYMYAHDTDICIFQDIKGGTKIINSAGKEIEKTIQDSLLATAFKYFESTPKRTGEFLYRQEFRVNRKSYFIVMNLDGKYSIIDENNKNIMAFDYDFIEMRNGKFISNKNNDFELFELIDGKTLRILKTKNARIFDSSFNFLIAKNNLFHTIKDESKVFVPYPIKEGKRIMWEKNFKETYFVQDTMGKWSSYFENVRGVDKYDVVTTFNEAQDYSMIPIRYINICKNGLWGLCDLRGNEVVKPIFEEIIRTDFDYLVVKNKNKHGIYNVNTKQYIFEPTYDFIMFISPYKYYALKDGEQFYLTF